MDWLTQWTKRYEIPAAAPGESHRLSGYAYGANHHVIVGDEGLILASTDGHVWTRQQSGTNRKLRAVIFGNDRFVAAGDFGIILTSTNAVAWSTNQILASWSGRPPNWQTALAYGSNKFFAVGFTDDILTPYYSSSDGTQWKSEGGGNEGLLATSMAHGNGGLVMVGERGFMVSASMRQYLTKAQLNGVAFGGGKFVVVGEKGTMLTSTNGRAWTMRSPGVSDDLLAVTYANGLYLVSSSGKHDPYRDSSLLISSNAVDWTSVASGTPLPITTLGYGNGLFVALANVGESRWTSSQILTSTNGRDWHLETNPLALRAIAAGDQSLVAVGDSGIILQSTNGISWNRRDSPVRAPLYDIVYAQQKFVAVGWSGAILQSADNGISWTEAASGTDLDLRAIAFGDGTFASVGGLDVQGQPFSPLPPVDHAIVTSTNASSWTISRMAIGFGGLADIAYGDGAFIVATGLVKDRKVLMLRSTDRGKFWQEISEFDANTFRPWGPLSMGVIEFGGGSFVVSTENNLLGTPYLFESQGGTYWTPLTPGPVTGLAFGGNTFLALRRGTVLYGTKTNWVEQSTGTAKLFYDGAFWKGSFYIVGEEGTILQSATMGESISPFFQTFEIRDRKFQASIKTVTGHVHVLEFKNSISDPSWTPLSTFSGDSAPKLFIDTNSVRQQRFYRVRLP